MRLIRTRRPDLASVAGLAADLRDACRTARMRRPPKILLAASILLTFGGFAQKGAPARAGLSTQAAQDVRAASQAYRDAWVANDATAVMATLTEEAVLLPSGRDPIVGSTAIKAFWWPPGAPPTKILAMELSVEEMGGEGGTAYVRGRGSVTFSYTKENKEIVVHQRHTFLNILKREAKGWRISHRMWTDLK